MNTSSYKRTYNIPFSFEELIRLIRSFSIEDKILLEKELEKETLVFRANKVSSRVKENNLSIDDIVSEVNDYRRVRNGKGNSDSGYQHLD